MYEKRRHLSMDTAKKSLRTRLEHADVIISHVDKFMSLAKDFIIGHNPDEYKAAASYSARVHAIIAAQYSLDKPLEESLGILCDMYTALGELDAALRHLISLFTTEHYIQSVVHNLSTSYALELYKMRDEAATRYVTMVETAAIDDEQFFTAIESAGISPDIIHKYISNEQRVNKFTVRMLSYAIKIASGGPRRQLEAVVESRKDVLLNATSTERAYTTEGILVRHNLRPHDITIADIPVATGIVVIDRSVGSAMEFSIDGLINPAFVHEHSLNTSMLAGLNKRVLQRFTTATLGAAGHPEAAGVIRDSTSGDWVVLDTINGRDYRLLQRALPVSTRGASPRINLLSGRPSRYNSIQADTILSSCFDEHAAQTIEEYKREKITVVSPDQLRSNIISRASEWFASVVKLIKSPAALRRRAVDQNVIREIVLGVMTRDIGQHPSADRLVTIMSQIDTIIHKYIKELDRQWEKAQIPARMFEEHSGDELHRMLTSIYTTVVTAATDELERAGVWADRELSLRAFVTDRRHV